MTKNYFFGKNQKLVNKTLTFRKIAILRHQ